MIKAALKTRAPGCRSSAVALPWPILDGEVKSRQLLGPSSVPPVKWFLPHEVFEAVVIRLNDDGSPATPQVMPPMCKGRHNGYN